MKNNPRAMGGLRFPCKFSFITLTECLTLDNGIFGNRKTNFIYWNIGLEAHRLEIKVNFFARVYYFSIRKAKI